MFVRVCVRGCTVCDCAGMCVGVYVFPCVEESASVFEL